MDHESNLHRLSGDPGPLTAEVSELLARVGVLLGAQRVDLFRINSTTAQMVKCWTALGVRSLPTASEVNGIDRAWFPWSLGNVASSDYMFAEAATQLPSDPDGASTLGEQGIASAVHVPLYIRTENGKARSGSLCAYWLAERSHFDDSVCERLGEWGAAALRLTR